MQLKSDEKPVLEGKEVLVGNQKMSLGSFLIQYNPLIILALLIIVASIISPIFSSSGNIHNLLRQQTTYMVIAIGVLMVMLTGGIDLSVSSMAAMSSIMVAFSMSRWGFENSGWGLVGAVAVGIGISALIGALNGFLVAQMRIPSFIVTLATMIAFQGVGFIITKGTTMQLDLEKPATLMLTDFAEKVDPLLGVPYTVYLAAAIVILFHLIMTYTSFGRLVIATGSNETAVNLAGINTKKYQFWVYTLCGALCGVAGVIITARTGSATPLTAAVDYNMSTIAGVVIGGTSLLGGQGTVAFTVVGVFIIAVIGNIMNLINLAAYPQMIVKAVIIILAVLLKSLSYKKR